MKIDWGSLSLKNFAALISEKLRQGGVETILVGGACVSMVFPRFSRQLTAVFLTSFLLIRR